jgi:signal transduction histidine kinase
MSLLRRHRWFVAAAGIILAYAFADITGLILLLAAASISTVNAFRKPLPERSFWSLMAFGFALWACNQASWGFYELVLKRQLPEPDFFDIVLFFHVVPMIAATAWRADLRKKEGSILNSVLNFVMLLGWWIFLYAFIVFPHQYILTNVATYGIRYDILYIFENAAWIAVLAFAARTSAGGWRRLYFHLFVAELVYATGAKLLNHAVSTGTYYSGSLYDIPFVASIAWMAAAVQSSREWGLETVEFNLDPRWKKLIPQLAMLAILSLPVLGLWTVAFDKSPVASRSFRILAVLAAMLLLGAFVFLRQYFQDQALLSLLKESRRAYHHQKELQNQLVQKEKLTSLGNLVAGAAHEINHPLNSIMSCSEQLWSTEKLTPNQDALLRKILHQASRTRDLVANLLSFAQQGPGQKTPVDLTVLLTRATQMLEPRRLPGNIQIKLFLPSDLPRVPANANRLFQVFIELIDNSMDALEEAGGGLLEINAMQHGEDVLLRFSDNGPGVRDPLRVFDPFYTTKPVGKGTGLGLSAVYGVIQDHDGQITCQNKPEGGAVFTLLLPINAKPTAQAASAAI